MEGTDWLLTKTSMSILMFILGSIFPTAPPRLPLLFPFPLFSILTVIPSVSTRRSLLRGWWGEGGVSSPRKRETYTHRARTRAYPGTSLKGRPKALERGSFHQTRRSRQTDDGRESRKKKNTKTGTSLYQEIIAFPPPRTQKPRRITKPNQP